MLLSYLLVLVVLFYNVIKIESRSMKDVVFFIMINFYEYMLVLN